MENAGDNKFWWDNPLIACHARKLDECTTREYLSRAVDYPIHQHAEYNHESDHLEVVFVDFEDKKEFVWEVSKAEAARIVMVKNAPDDWDIPEFANSLLSEWFDVYEGRNGTRYLALLPPPAQAFMELEEFWKDQVMPHDQPANDWPQFKILTRNGWVKSLTQAVAAWVTSIDVGELDSELIDDSDAVREYRREHSAPVTSFLTG
ncbi:hypothetical protein F5B19DRAFT_441853 [Rostrohypoxylon terebratum]|nr:hypothetical protein F5B19DRAFT_441853 [Rostrohypoxylon terebratum]